MSIITNTGTEAPTQYPADFHPAYWQFPEGQPGYTGIIRDIQMKQRQAAHGGGPVCVIYVVNGPYYGQINLDPKKIPSRELARIFAELEALKDGKPASALLAQAIGKPISFTHNEFKSPDGKWLPVLRFGTVIPQVTRLSPTVKFGWTHPEVFPQTLT